MWPSGAEGLSSEDGAAPLFAGAAAGEAAYLEKIGETLLLLDETPREVGPRTQLQDRMIDLYANCTRPRFEVTEPEGAD